MSSPSVQQLAKEIFLEDYWKRLSNNMGTSGKLAWLDAIDKALAEPPQTPHDYILAAIIKRLDATPNDTKEAGE